ncbi:ribonuclease Oy-like isoform X2 [Haliotis rufescens]|uniref:ribonuclease Oy-like isoform X2 n=1 Tax=Haliotis rufescens TaxID=6454 RepID=UPI00201F09E1|nr:ribonuclease Oy-like isoform X2 [Haliotis rufescens]
MAVRGIVIVLSLSLINTAISWDKKWTFFVFAQQWPPSVCNSASHLKHKCKAVPNQVKTWTVHGLWPNLGKKSIENCNHKWHFNWDQIQSLEKQLNASWPNLFIDTDHTGLWALEKAGITPSCSKAYSIYAIQAAVKKYFKINTSMTIACTRQRHTGRTLLMEIHIALLKTFNVTAMPKDEILFCKPADKIFIFPVHNIDCF